MKPVLAGVADKAARSTDQGRHMPTESIRARAFESPVILPLFVGAAIASAALPLLIGYAPFGHRAIERQKDREDRSLCDRFECSTANARRLLQTCVTDASLCCCIRAERCTSVRRLVNALGRNLPPTGCSPDATSWTSSA